MANKPNLAKKSFSYNMEKRALTKEEIHKVKIFIKKNHKFI